MRILIFYAERCLIVVLIYLLLGGEGRIINKSLISCVMLAVLLAATVSVFCAEPVAKADDGGATTDLASGIVVSNVTAG